MDYQMENKVCDICGSKNVKLLWEQIGDGTCVTVKDSVGRPIHHKDVMCMDCGLIYKNPSFTRPELARFYKEEYTSLYRPSWEKSISKELITHTLYTSVLAIDWLKARMLLKGKTVLEIGSGDGIFARCMSAEGALVTPIDLDPRAVEIARKLHGIDTLQADFMDGNGINGKFDIVCLRNTIEHMYSPREALLAASSYLQDDGIILIEVPSAAMPYPAIPVGAFLSAAHNYTFLPETITLLAQKCGLAVRDLQFAGHNSCMLIILNKDKEHQTIPNQAEEIYTFLNERYKEHNETYFQCESIILKLLDSTNVSNTIEYIKSHKHTSNIITYHLLNRLPATKWGLKKMSEIFDGYTWSNAQASDLQCCAATFEYFRGMFYREMGDFTRAIEQYKKAKFLYPRFMEHNVVKEMLLEGILSEQHFNGYFWYSNEKTCKLIE